MRANEGPGALEEDARLTALFLWTLQSTSATANADDSTSPSPRGREPALSLSKGGSRRRGSPAPTDEGLADESDDDLAEDDDSPSTTRKPGLTLIYDVARRFAQPLGIHLPDWEGRIIETKKGLVHLLPVAERAPQLFGKEGATAVADRIQQNPTGPVQLALFTSQSEATAPTIRGRRPRTVPAGSPSPLVGEGPGVRAPTTLDRVHAAMLLQAAGQTNALRALLKAEQERGPDFLRLANALSALYPTNSQEKRLLDGMLLAMPR